MTDYIFAYRIVDLHFQYLLFDEFCMNVYDGFALTFLSDFLNFGLYKLLTYVL